MRGRCCAAGRCRIFSPSAHFLAATKATPRESCFAEDQSPHRHRCRDEGRGPHRQCRPRPDHRRRRSAAQVEARLIQAMHQARAQGRPLQGVVELRRGGGLASNLRRGDIVCPTPSTRSTTITRAIALGSPFAKHLPRPQKGALVASTRPSARARPSAGSHDTHAPRGGHRIPRRGALRRAHSLPFVALRAIADPHHRSLPAAALVGMEEDGSADVRPV